MATRTHSGDGVDTGPRPVQPRSVPASGPEAVGVGPERLGPYRLINVLGEGGMGVVHLGLDRTGRAVAVKVLRPHVAHDAAARTRLARELDTLSRVRDPGVAAVLDADLDGERPYLVTQFVPGPSLEDVVRDSGPLGASALLQLGEGLAGGLNAIHAAGVVHRDLKPGNVLLLDGRPIIIDFGIAHVADDVRLTMTGLVMGTPGYLSPEVVEGEPVTPATDWWGWAATLAYAAAGRPPFGRGPMNAVLDRVRGGRADLSGVDPRLAPLLHAALSPEPDARPHAREIVGALHAYAAGAAVTLPVPRQPAHQSAHQPARQPAQPPRPQSPPTAVVGVGETRAAPRSAVQTAAPSSTSPDAPAPAGPDAPPDLRHPDSRALDAGPRLGPDPHARRPGADPRAVGPGGGDPYADPRIGRPARIGTLTAMLVLVVAVAAVWPAISVGLFVLWCLLARFADRSVTSRVLRRHGIGPRRSDPAVAVLSAPWHLLSAVLATVLTLVLPALVALASAFFAALLLAAAGQGGAGGLGAVASGGRIGTVNAVVTAAGLLGGVLMSWWGPGGASLRRGSRSLVRGTIRTAGVTRVVTALFLAAAVGLGGWSLLQHGDVSWWPSTRQSLELGSVLRAG